MTTRSKTTNLFWVAAALLRSSYYGKAFSTSTVTSKRKGCISRSPPQQHPSPSHHHHHGQASYLLLSESSKDDNDIIGPINEDIWQEIRPTRIEGKSLRTWSFNSSTTKRVQVSIRSPLDRPIEGSIQLWQTPTYIPTKFDIECEDGSEVIVHSIIELPSGGEPVTVAIYNTEDFPYPMDAIVVDSTPLGSAWESFCNNGSDDDEPSVQPQLLQGNGAVKTYHFGHNVLSVEVLLVTDQRNMKAFIEILQGPNDDDEVIEVDCEDATVHPFYTIIQTPEGANTLRIKNEHSVEFPFWAYVRPLDVEGSIEDGQAQPQFNYGGPYF